MCCRSTKAILLSIVLMVGWAAWSAPARAVTSDEIETGLLDWFANTLSHSKTGASATLDGQVTVTPAGAGFRALLPPIRFVPGSETGLEFRIDPIVVDLQPLVSGGYAANWTLPDRIHMHGRDGAVAAIAIGRQSVHGLYAPELGLMISSDLELHDIRAAVPDRPPHLALDSLVVSLRQEPVAPDLFDQTTEIQITGLTALKEDGTEAMRIAAVSLTGGARGVHLSAWRDLRAPYAHRPKSSAGLPDRIAAPQMASIDGRPALLASARSRHRISGARFNLPAGDLSIGDGVLDLSMDGLDSGSASLAIAFSVSELGLPSAIGPLTPREMAVDLVLSGLPTDRLIDALAALFASAGLADSSHALAMFGLHLQDLMMTSGGQIEIREILLIADDARLRVAGTVKPTYAAPLGVVARLDMSVGGLGSLIEAASADPDDAGTLQELAVLQAVGTAGADPDGTPVLRYSLDINQQGQVLLNGADLMPALASASP